MEEPQRIAIPAKWKDALHDRLSVELLPPSRPFSLVRDFGWMSFDLPTQASSCWYIEWVHRLREGLAFFVLAAAVNSSVWRELVGFSAYHESELKVRFRFCVGSRLTDVADLLDWRRGYSSSFMQACEQMLGSPLTSPTATRVLNVPISLVVKPVRWTPTLLNEITGLYKLYNQMQVDTGCIAYDIVDVQLDLQETVLSDTTVFALLMFLKSDVPLSALTVVIDAARWNSRDVATFIQAADRASMTALKIVLHTSMYYDTVVTALETVSHLTSVVIDISSLDQVVLRSEPTTTSSKTTSSIRALRWTSQYHPIPASLRGIDSLGLSIHESWTSQLRMVGSHLRALQLYGEESSQIAKVLVDAVLRACPLLQSLEVRSVMIDSLDPIIEGYDSGSCRLRSLKLEHIQITHADSVTRLAMALADSNSQTSNTLFEFSWVPIIGDVPSDVMNLFADVVKSSPRLQHLELKYMHTDTAAVASLLRHHFQPLLAYDHAFLGLVKDASVVNIAAIKQLSDDLVGRIFTFAGICERRSVRIITKE